MAFKTTLVDAVFNVKDITKRRKQKICINLPNVSRKRENHVDPIHSALLGATGYPNNESPKYSMREYEFTYTAEGVSIALTAEPASSTAAGTTNWAAVAIRVSGICYHQ
jgi:hypothetical protein